MTGAFARRNHPEGGISRGMGGGPALYHSGLLLGRVRKRQCHDGGDGQSGLGG